MLLFALLAGLVWVIGAAMGVGRPVRGTLIFVLWVFALLATWVLPEGNGIRVAFGGTPALWLMVAGVVALAWGYARLVGGLRRRGNPGEAAAPEPRKGGLSETELERYARHIVLREIGGPGQKRLKAARVLVLGAGGLGAPALQYLAAAGVGTIGVIDDDDVELANLQRQVIHTEDWLGKPKVFSAEAAIRALNPHVFVRPYNRRFEAGIAADLVAEYDLVLDGTDNFDTRYLANRVCAAAGKPLISGALSQWEGQLSVFDPARGTPCYQCIFPEAPAPGLAPSCAEAGVMGPLPGVVGAMMAGEAVKLICEAGAPLRGEMLIYDALWSETRKLTLKRRADCPICGQGADSPEEKRDDQPAA